RLRTKHNEHIGFPRWTQPYTTPSPRVCQVQNGGDYFPQTGPSMPINKQARALSSRGVSALRFASAKAILAGLLCVPISAAAHCGPSPLGAPCAIGGIASMGQAEPGLAPAAGNPINIISGNKYQLE